MKKNLIKKIVSIGTVMSVMVGCAMYTDAAFAEDAATSTPQPATEQPQTQPAEDKFLEDGEYAVPVTLIKTTNKNDKSMAADSVLSPVKVVSEGGIVKATLTFKPIDKPPFKGYLGALQYFKTGFQVSDRGNVTGELIPAVVEKYHTNADGTRVSDAYGTDYPEIVTIEVAKEAFKDGYMPVTVNIPVMEKIAGPGGGTQKVYVKFDWAMAKKVEPGSQEEPTNDADNNSKLENPMDNQMNNNMNNMDNANSMDSSVKDVKKMDMMKKDTPKTADETSLLGMIGTMTVAGGAALALRKKAK